MSIKALHESLAARGENAPVLVSASTGEGLDRLKVRIEQKISSGHVLRAFRINASEGGLINWLSPWIFVPTLVVAPIFQILLFVYIGRSAGVQSDEFYVIGNAVQYASIPCLFSMTHAIAGERYQQTLAYILVSPAGRLPR